MGAAQAIDLKSTIVLGSELRILLGSEHVSYGDIYASLKEKGVFVGNSDKSTTVPLLSAMLLTPDNFIRLIESGVNRESLPKVKVAVLDLVAQDSDWIAPLKKDLFNDSFDVLGSMSGVEFLTSPHMVVRGDKVSIPYRVVRQDYSKDWIQRELIFDAQVTIERQCGELKLEFTSTHSSKETEQVNKRITARVAKLLHGQSLVKEGELLAVTFGAFNNEERVRYFKRLTAGCVGCISPGCVNDIEICLDSNGPALPDDPQISWMKQTVRRFNVDGDRLNDIFLINNEKYYRHYFILRMDVTFPFKVAANEGECRVSFSFGGGRAVSPSSELVFEILRWSYKDSPNADARRLISSEVQNGLRSVVEQMFNQAIAERLQATSAPTPSA